MFVLMHCLVLLGGEGLEAEGTVKGTEVFVGDADMPLETVPRSEPFPA
jgi:hypothetical protein